MGAQRLGRGGHELLEVLAVPGHEALRRRLCLGFARLFRVPARLRQRARPLDVVFGSLAHDAARRVEAAASGTPCYLVELARVQPAHATSVVFGQRRQEHGVDGHVDAYAQGVGPAYDGQKPLLRELFDEQAVARQHAGMVDADPAQKQTAQRLAEGRGEAHTRDGLLHPLALLLARHAVARKRLGALVGRVLGEVHDVDGACTASQLQLDC